MSVWFADINDKSDLMYGGCFVMPPDEIAQTLERPSSPILPICLLLSQPFVTTTSKRTNNEMSLISEK